jgi:hypothetical protein
MIGLIFAGQRALSEAARASSTKRMGSDCRFDLKGILIVAHGGNVTIRWIKSVAS